MSDEYVQVPVPNKWVHEVFRLLVDLEARESSGPGSEEVEETPELLYRRMYVDSHPRHRELLQYLATHPDEWISTSKVAEALSIESGSRGAGGMIGAFGRRANNRYGGLKPWRQGWNAATQENSYLMDRDVAEEFISIFNEVADIGL